MANIAFIQHRLGRTDGVSLEVDKFRYLLEQRGHTVLYLAGNEDVPGGHFIPELFPFHPVTQRIIANATRAMTDYASPADLLADVRCHADLIKPKMLKFLREQRIDAIFPNNLLSVGFNLPGMLALHEVIEETGIPTVSHNHDFWWEDSGEVYPTSPEVEAFYRAHAPPPLTGIRHLVINSLAQNEMKKRCGLESRVVPNVFDFNQPSWAIDAYNQDFRASIGLGPNDLMFLQATRVLDRKGIELAIDLIAELSTPDNRRLLESTPLYDGRRLGQDSRIVLVCAGYVEGIGLSGSYAQGLRDRAAAKGVEVIWCADRVAHSRGTANGEKIYALWDVYPAADFVTYPSVWEGWGNQFIEAVFAKLPVVLFEYPVYLADLKASGFQVVSLGEQAGPKDSAGLLTLPQSVLAQAAAETISLLHNAEKRAVLTEHNYGVARRCYSYEVLDSIIGELLESLGLPQTVVRS